ncbi:MAG TPA: HPF/RaiA family ribosome-associated protein [Haliangium sp.]|nr:HPF/RaiA family ribosome-associated protein [Haliangium sp.]
MNFPIQITFRGMEASAGMEEAIRTKAEDLGKYYDRIVRCHVTVEAPSQHHRQGMAYRVRVELSVPGQDIVASREPGDDNAHEDPYVALRDSFRAARDELKSHVGRMREQQHKGERIAEGLNQ